MKKSNLFLILSKLDKKELRELRKWLQSPAHNQREDVILLFEYFVANLSSSKQANLTKELAFSSVYPKLKTYDDGKMRQSIHFLFKNLEDFLVFNELKSEEIQKEITLSRVLRKKGIDKGFQKTIQAAHNLQEKEALRNTRYHQIDYEIRQEEIRFQGAHGRAKGFNFQGLSDALDTMFISAKLRDACTMVSFQTVNQTDLDTGLLDHILEYLKNNKQLILIPAIGVYYYGLRCAIDNEDDLGFQSLKNLIFTSEQQFPHFEFRNIYLMAINFCLRRANSGFKSYLRDSFELYKNGIKEGVLLENGYISKFTFLNIVSNGARLGEFEWLDEFLQSNGDKIHPKDRENIIHYCNSKLEFERGNYNKAMVLLSQIEYDDILMNLSGKTMLLKMFYEEDNLDSLDSLISSTNTYIQRKKVIGYHRSNYKNILKSLKKLSKVNPYEKDQLEKLKDEIIATNPLTERDWLLSQISKLN